MVHIDCLVFFLKWIAHIINLKVLKALLSHMNLHHCHIFCYFLSKRKSFYFKYTLKLFIHSPIHMMMMHHHWTDVYCIKRYQLLSIASLNYTTFLFSWVQRFYVDVERCIRLLWAHCIALNLIALHIQ